MHDLVAQLVEHLPFKERVLGSSPSQITSLFKKAKAFFLFDLVAQLVEHLPFKERVLGSSPSQITSFAQMLELVDRHG
jgi:hypothetical protein